MYMHQFIFNMQIYVKYEYNVKYLDYLAQFSLFSQTLISLLMISSFMLTFGITYENICVSQMHQPYSSCEPKMCVVRTWKQLMLYLLICSTTAFNLNTSFTFQKNLASFVCQAQRNTN